MQYTVREFLEVATESGDLLFKFEAHINYDYRPARRQRRNDPPEEAEIDVTSIDIVADDGKPLPDEVKAWLRGLVRAEDYMERMINEAEEGRVSAAEMRAEARQEAWEDR